MLKFSLFSLIFMLEILLQSSVILILAILLLWVLFLALITSPLWIPLSICWAPAAIITFVALRYTQVIKIDSKNNNRLEIRRCNGQRGCFTICYTDKHGLRSLSGKIFTTYSHCN